MPAALHPSYASGRLQSFIAADYHYRTASADKGLERLDWDRLIYSAVMNVSPANDKQTEN